MSLRARLRNITPPFILVSVFVALAVPINAIHAQRAQICGDSLKRETMRTRLDYMMQADDSTSRVMRRAYGLPRVHPDSVVPIDDPRICERAAARYYRDVLGPPSLQSGVSVTRVGDRYVVYGSAHGGEWTAIEVYDLAFRYITGILG